MTRQPKINVGLFGTEMGFMDEGPFSPSKPKHFHEIDEWHKESNAIPYIIVDRAARACKTEFVYALGPVNIESERPTPEAVGEITDGRLVRTWSTSVVSLGSERYRLKYPIVIVLEDYETEIIASWPEVEAWGTGSTDAEAINALKDDIVRLCDDLVNTPTDKLGKLPRRWALALNAIVEDLARGK